MDNEQKNGAKKDTNDKKAAHNLQKKTPKKPKGANDEFKRRYFDYYDDIKISDRQDW
ncbi:MAG: hypothetical protein PUI31_00595 [Clostridia bacterium]|nr:hypothetical protein [Clostridia bacterium]